MKYKYKLYFLFVGLSVWTATLCLGIAYIKTRAIIFDELRSKVLSIAATGAHLFNGDLLDQEITSKQEQDVLNSLIKIREHNRRSDVHVVHLYIIRPDPMHANGFSIVVDAANELERPAAHSGDLYPEAMQIGLLDHLEEIFSPDHLITDRWGTFLSGFAPIRDAEGSYVATFGVSLSSDYAMAQLRPLVFGILIAAGVVFVLGMIIAALLAHLLTRSLNTLTQAVELIGKGDLQTKVFLKTRDEFDLLGQAINAMTIGLEERECVKENFIRYVSKDVLQRILSSNKKPILSGERRKVTILFSDIRGFTPFAEKLAPEEVFSILNEYFAKMLDAIFANQGTLDKFLGDGLMVEFGAPLEDQNQEKNAVKTAIEMHRALKELCQKWGERKQPQIQMGIGIHTGQAILGDIGSEKRVEYTAIGDAVNVAHLLQEATKTFRVPILISENTEKGLQGAYPVQRLGTTNLPGHEAPVTIYSVSPSLVD